MKTAEAIAKELRSEAERFHRAADVLDPPAKPERKKPGPKPGRRRKAPTSSNGSRGSPSPISSVPTGRSLGMASESVDVGGPADGAA